MLLVEQRDLVGLQSQCRQFLYLELEQLQACATSFRAGTQFFELITQLFPVLKTTEFTNAW